MKFTREHFAKKATMDANRFGYIIQVDDAVEIANERLDQYLETIQFLENVVIESQNFRDEVLTQNEKLHAERDILLSKQSQYESTMKETMRVRDELQAERNDYRDVMERVLDAQHHDADWTIKKIADVFHRWTKR